MKGVVCMILDKNGPDLAGDPKVIEVEYNGEPSYIIGIEHEGKVIAAVKFIDPMDAIGEIKPFWINRPELAWHCPIKSIVEEILQQILEKKNVR